MFNEEVVTKSLVPGSAEILSIERVNYDGAPPHVFQDGLVRQK